MGKHLKEISFPLTDVVVFPQTIQRIKVPDDLSIDNRHLVALYSKKQQLSSTGVLCELIDEQHQPDGRFIVIEGMQRVNIHERKSRLCHTPYVKRQ